MDQNRRIWYAGVAAGFIGLVASIIFAGPHFREWAPSTVVLVLTVGASAGAVFGVILGIMATGKPDLISKGGDGPGDPMGPFGGLGASRGAFDHSDTDHNGGHE